MKSISTKFDSLSASIAIERKTIGPQAQPLVSVLTPVYNGEKYLTDCIESVLAQTYQNWEYIIINNRSTDHSLEIVQSYAQKEARIRIYNNQEFVDVIRNHNIAFRQISPDSKYCKVLHADDWLFPECISQMVKIAEAHPSVGIVGSYGLYGAAVKCDGLPYPSTVISGREICRMTLLGGPYVFLSPSSLLIRSDLIRTHNPFYHEPHIYADVEAYYEVLQHSDFGFAHQVLTYIRRHDESMTSSFAHKLNTIILANLYFLIKYGPLYLSHEEYAQRSKIMMDDYYGFLAESMFRFRKKQFWDYHRDGLKEMRCPFSWTRLARALASKLSDILLNPKQTTEFIARRILKLLVGKRQSVPSVGKFFAR